MDYFWYVDAPILTAFLVLLNILLKKHENFDGIRTEIIEVDGEYVG